jgi:hypothetical protein
MSRSAFHGILRRDSFMTRLVDIVQPGMTFFSDAIVVVAGSAACLWIARANPPGRHMYT